MRRWGTDIDYAINVDVPDSNIVKRMSGRRACVTCGATYHIEHIPPKVEGICDRCGGELILRSDDKPETVQKRLDVYHAQTQPLIDFYESKKKLVTVDGTKDMEDVFADITAVLEGLVKRESKTKIGFVIEDLWQGHCHRSVRIGLRKE